MEIGKAKSVYLTGVKRFFISKYYKANTRKKKNRKIKTHFKSLQTKKKKK